jgi:hypothetical protein
MWKSGRHHVDEEKLDRFGDELLRVFEASDAEINTAANSPFLYRRIRARIEAEERRLAQQRNSWLALLFGVKRAIPVMAMLAIVALASLMFTPSLSPPRQATNGMNEDTPTLMSDVFSFSQDELLASAVGLEAGQSTQGGGKR